MDNFCVIIWLNKKREKPLHSNMNFTVRADGPNLLTWSDVGCLRKICSLWPPSQAMNLTARTPWWIHFCVRRHATSLGSQQRINREDFLQATVRSKNSVTLGSLFFLIFWGRLSSVRGFCEAASLWQALRCGCRDSICLRSSYRVPVSTGLHSWFRRLFPKAKYLGY